jgi:hypothetical protein
MNPIPSPGSCVTFCNMGVFCGKNFSVAMLKYITGEPPIFRCLIVCLVYSQLHPIYMGLSLLVTTFGYVVLWSPGSQVTWKRRGIFDYLNDCQLCEDISVELVR